MDERRISVENPLTAIDFPWVCMSFVWISMGGPNWVLGWQGGSVFVHCSMNLSDRLKISGSFREAQGSIKGIIVLSYAPSAAAGWHLDSIRVIYGSKLERRSVVV